MFVFGCNVGSGYIVELLEIFLAAINAFFQVCIVCNVGTVILQNE
jgi:hypothetical protein